MHINTAKTLAKTVAERWKQQYFYNGQWSSLLNGSSEDIYRKLVAAKGNVGKVDKVLDGGGWIRYMCCECKECKDPTVEFGEDDWGATVCLDCIRDAATRTGRDRTEGE